MTAVDAPSPVDRIRRGVGRRLRSLRRALAGPPPEAPVVAERLPLPEQLIALDSAPGAAMLAEVGAGWHHDALSLHYVPQRSPKFCGPATIAIVLNALHGEPGRYDQDSVFTRRTEAVKRRDEVLQGGMGLAILRGYLAAHDVDAEACFAADTSREGFTETLVPLLREARVFVAANYHRPTLGQVGTGHISPLAAYHAPSDRFLVLDVSRHRYPPVWVRACDLFAAMRTVAGTHSRGFVIARR